jgi:WD40 repeat protein
VALIGHNLCRFAAFDPDGQSLLLAGAEGLLRYRLLRLPDGTVRVFHPVSFGEDPGVGDEVTRGLEKYLTGRPKIPPRPPVPVASAGLSADGARAVIAPTGGAQASVLDRAKPQAAVLLKGQPNVNLAAITPDGKLLATGTWGGKGVRVWEADTGKRITDLPAPGSANVAFSPDGRSLATSTAETIQLWDTQTWQPRFTVHRETAELPARLVFSPDASVLAVTRTRTETSLLDPKSGGEVARLPTSGGPLCFSKAGDLLVTEAESGTVQVWDLKRIREQLAEMGLDWR